MANKKTSTLLIKVIGQLLNVLAIFSPNRAAKIAIDIFSKPQKGKLSSDQNSFLSSAKITILNFQGTDIMTYYWPGANGCVLLAHGWESNSLRWEKLIASLQEKNIGAVALDAPAHGASGGSSFQAVLYANFINVVAQRFQADSMVGHSVGGMACAFSTQYLKSSQMNKLILLGAPNNFTGVLERYSNLLGYSNRLRAAINLEVLKRFGSPPEFFATEKYLNNPELSTLIIHDINDKIIPFTDAEEIKTNGRNVKLIATEGFGHGLKHPEVVSEIVNYICN